MTARDLTRPVRRLGRKLRRSVKSKYGKLNILIMLAGLIIVTVIGISVTGFLKQPGMDSYRPLAEGTHSADVNLTTAAAGKNEPAGGSVPAPGTPAEEEGTAASTGNKVRDINSTEAEKSQPDAGTSAQSAGSSTISGTSPNAAENAGTAEIQSTAQNTAGNMDGWIEKKIAEHRSEIDDKDLQDFRAISSKLDQGYIRNIYKGGLTDDEQNELRSYLNLMLTSAEYERAKQLFAKYVYLLDGE